MFPNHLKQLLPALGVATAGLLSSAGARALNVVPVLTTFHFNGSCSDCTLAGAPTATLVLQDYTPEAEILAANLYEFHYAGSEHVNAFTVGPWIEQDFDAGHFTFYPAFDTVSGAMPADNGPADFVIRFSDGIGFESRLSGEWFVCAPGGTVYYAGSCDLFNHNDVGEGVWSIAAVPEPASYALMGLGLLGLAALRRRSKD